MKVVSKIMPISSDLKISLTIMKTLLKREIAVKTVGLSCQIRSTLIPAPSMVGSVIPLPQLESPCKAIINQANSQEVLGQEILRFPNSNIPQHRAKSFL